MISKENRVFCSQKRSIHQQAKGDAQLNDFKEKSLKAHKEVDHAFDSLLFGFAFLGPFIDESFLMSLDRLYYFIWRLFSRNTKDTAMANEQL